jgi:natural product biosynthesis luciferase-like monooxygenase protein
LSFSVFFFEGEAGGQNEHSPYALLLEAARYADARGFEAVWTPERHFNAFGGLYPNPALTGAAVAAVTRQIRIRGGSVIAPLHHPARIAEDWAVLDNLSCGRVDLCFAAGFHPNDFVFGAGAFQDRGPDTLRVLEEVQRLWQGGNVHEPDGSGRPLNKPVFPRPVQFELPFWLAATRHANTFVEAGRRGGNVLTALLRLSLAELTQRTALYRHERAAAGFDPATGRVSLMIHAFAGESEEAVSETVAGPLKRYVRSHMEFLAPLNSGSLQMDAGDAEDLMAFAVERFYRDCALFGTVDQCVERVLTFKAAGVDEIACLLDFGVSADEAMASLVLLGEVRDRVLEKLSVSSQTRRHG